MLATLVNSLALASRSTTRPCALFGPLRPGLHVTVQFQALLTPLSRFFSVFPLGTEYAIGLELYFRVAS